MMDHADLRHELQGRSASLLQDAINESAEFSALVQVDINDVPYVLVVPSDNTGPLTSLIVRVESVTVRTGYDEAGRALVKTITLDRRS